MKVKGLVSAIGWVSLLTAFGKLLALLREGVIATYFGTSASVDAYLIALFIPITAPLFASGSVNLAFIPVLTKHHLKGEQKEAWAYLNALLTLWCFSSTVFVCFAFAQTRWLVKLMAPGFGGEQLESSLTLMRVGIFALPFSGMGVILNAAFHVEKRFILPAFSSCMPNFFMALCVFAFGKNIGVLSLMLGIVVGEISRFFVQLPNLYASGWRYKVVSPQKLFNAKGGLKLTVFGGGLVLISQAYIMVDRLLASSLPIGSISALGFAQRTFSFIYEVLALSVATVFFPTFAEKSMLLKEDELLILLKKGFVLLICLTLPLSVFLFCFSSPLVALLFQRGEFEHTATLLVADAVSCFSLQLFAASALSLMLRAFYSINDAQTPFIIALISLFVGIMLKLILAPQKGIKGLVIASAIAMNLNAALNLYYLWRRLKSSDATT